jgi:Domain of unknown function (DUF1840)
LPSNQRPEQRYRIEIPPEHTISSLDTTPITRNLRQQIVRQCAHEDNEEELTMLVRFSSTKTGSITMFGDVAVQLIRLLGASGTIPGAIGPEDIPGAIQRLRQYLQSCTEAHPERSETVMGQADGKDHEPQVALATRAAPLVGLLEQAAAANAPVMWEAG